MNIRAFGLAAAALAAFAPSICNASTESSVQACARAFAARIAGEPAAVPRYKLDYTDSRSTGSIADYFPTGSILILRLAIQRPVPCLRVHAAQRIPAAPLLRCLCSRWVTRT